MKKLNLIIALSTVMAVSACSSSGDEEIELVTEKRVTPIAQNASLSVNQPQLDLNVQTSTPTVPVTANVLPALQQPAGYQMPEVSVNIPRVATSIATPSAATTSYAAPQVTTTSYSAPTASVQTGSFQVPAGVKPQVVSRQVYRVNPGQGVPYLVPSNASTRTVSGTTSVVTGQPIVSHHGGAVHTGTVQTGTVRVNEPVVQSGNVQYIQTPTNVVTTSGVYPTVSGSTTVTETTVTEQQ